MRIETPQDAYRALKAEFNELAKAFNGLVAHVNAQTQRANRMNAANPTEAAKAAIREEYEQVKNYANLLMGVGYAGFFGLWALVKEVDHPRIYAIAALCICISLVFYVAWEISQIFRRGFALRKVMTAGEINHITYAQVQRDVAARTLKWWVWFFVPSVVLGMAGAGCLLSVLLARVVKELTG